MRFTLRYAGDGLLSAGNTATRKREKQLLRTHFHQQLKRLWEANNVLRGIPRTKLTQPIKVHDSYDLPRPLGNVEPLIRNFLFRVQYHNSWFIPLITGPMEAHCHLAIRVGRPIKPGSIVFDGGDLDGRLKTLFDALAIPKEEHSLDPRDVSEQEHICLLSDDSLITALSIESYELLEGGCSENYIDLDIAVTVTAVTPMPGTWTLLFG